tara:strand:+ start:387 stop:863 length:477 start_codon:yes stop_codon:yes gene_type:complete
MAKIHPDKKFQYFNNISNDVEITTIVREHGAFATNASFFCFLAAIGFRNGKKIKTKQRNNWGEVQGGTFDTTNLTSRIYAIALASEKDYSIIKDEDKCFSLFEEYVNGGFNFLLEFSTNYNDGTDFIDGLLEYVREISLDNAKHEDILDPVGGLDLEE